MTWYEDRAEQGRRRQIGRATRERVSVARPETEEEWPLPSALLAGLALALLFNTFIGVIPG
ncbi:hypothetical protein [Bosea sp. 124]|uniref:hypothetical protein n=1 Tax=Bosea sp. 124 TaxID=2135642 RepID=UPI000D4BFA7A|nr:hypothetical protein [Bosea sp. 124]PTM42272.1 hypothetical protein C8D03_3857 [Bosea sp. 124]